jgi:hypothetical protein
MSESIQFTKIKHDINGNPRYVCHFLNLLTNWEKENLTFVRLDSTSLRYAVAIVRAKKIGGRKYHTKSYGGGIVFQSYSLKELEQSIREIVAKDEQP